MMNKLTQIFIFSLFLIGCQNNDKRINKKKYYPSGKLKSYGYYVQDSIPVDTLFTLYEDGKMSSKEVYDSIGNAVKSISYFRNEIISKEIVYKNGLANGFAFDYFENSLIKQKSFFYNDLQTGDTYIYYEKTGEIRFYNFYDWKERNINLIRYDSTTGKPIKDMRQTIYLDSVITFTEGSKNKVAILLAISNPPYCKSVVYIDYLSKDGNILKHDSVSGKPFYSIIEQFADSLFAIRFTGSQYDSLLKSNYEQWNKKIVDIE